MTGQLSTSFLPDRGYYTFITPGTRNISEHLGSKKQKSVTCGWHFWLSDHANIILLMQSHRRLPYFTHMPPLPTVQMSKVTQWSSSCSLIQARITLGAAVIHRTLCHLPGVVWTQFKLSALKKGLRSQATTLMYITRGTLSPNEADFTDNSWTIVSLTTRWVATSFASRKVQTHRVRFITIILNKQRPMDLPIARSMTSCHQCVW